MVDLLTSCVFWIIVAIVGMKFLKDAIKPR
jgi:hypothetical protein